MSEVFLWPQPSAIKFSQLIGRENSLSTIEEQVHGLYPLAFPVLFSSARAGLRCVLEHLGLARPDLVWCPPFSSHCVFDAVSRVATPVTLPVTAPAAALVYHQWGHVHRHEFSSATVIIEDAVDTLLAPGASPFACGGRFALWSLPKVIASPWGGVVFCQQREDADALRRMRDRRPGSPALQAILRPIGERHPAAAAYWHGAEASAGRLPIFALRAIADGLDQLADLTDRRRQRLAELQPYSLAATPSPDRLPSNLPLPPLAALATPLSSGKTLTGGYRNFNIDCTSPAGNWVKVFPAPLHQDINGTDVAEFIRRITVEPSTLEI